jgi:hypothetical protein
MDRIIAVFADLPEKHFRTIVLVALAALLGFAGKAAVDIAVLKNDTVWYHGKK